jgi:hypothetical protein
MRLATIHYLLEIPWFLRRTDDPDEVNAVHMDESLTHLLRASRFEGRVNQNEQISSKEDEAAQCRQT